MGCSVAFELLILFSVTLLTNIETCECKAFEFGKVEFPPTESGSEKFFGQLSGVGSGKRDYNINGNILNGDLSVSTLYTNEEIMERVLLGGGIVLLFIFCCVCCKHCCYPNKPSTVIMYQQMPPTAQPQQPANVPPLTNIPGEMMIPMRNQGFPEIHSQFQFMETSPPPPYPGLAV